MAKNNLEIESAIQTVELLKKYKAAKTQAEKDNLLKQMDEVDLFASKLIVQHKISPKELITKMTKAIAKDKYRPKNIPIAIFALNKDLDFIKGDFDSFDANLNKMFKDKEDAKKIRNAFKAATVNVYMLAKQFSMDWIRWLNKHKKLADAARNAGEKDMVAAYNKLFNALSKDFCKKYDCDIGVKVITDWASSDVNPGGDTDACCGYHHRAYSMSYPADMPEAEKDKLIQDFLNDPKNHPNTRKASLVRVNITTVKKFNPDRNEFFYKMISVFAHEMHHALDYQNPRQGALGPQIEQIDMKTYVPENVDKKAYYESATETSSYTIDRELFKMLKNQRF